jgi:phospholipase/carboxylesterase
MASSIRGRTSTGNESERERLDLRQSMELLSESTVQHDSALSYEFVPSRRPGRREPLLVLLHGHASNEGDLLGLVPYLDDRFQIASPRGPQRLAAGAYAWFRTTYAASGPIVHEGEESESRKRLAAFIDEVASRYGADPTRVYLLGFSEGATLALSFALTVPEQIAGVAALSGRLLREVLPTIADPEELAGCPMFLGYGIHDDVVPIGRARSTREFLAGFGVDLDYREYPSGHQIGPQALMDVAAWLSARLDAPRRDR